MNRWTALNDCPPIVIRSAAAAIRQLADSLEWHAATVQNDLNDRQAQKDYRRRLRAASEELCDRIDRGDDPDSAAQDLAERHAVEAMALTTVRPVANRRRRQRRAAEIERAVMKGWRAGLTDREISARLPGRPHPKHVARVRRAAQKELSEWL